MAKKNNNANSNKNTKKNVKKGTGANAMKQAVKKAIDRSEVHTGTIKFNDIRKGYGFIIDNKTGDEIFFHYTGIKSGRVYKGFMNNDQVSFKLAPGAKGPEANEIILEVQPEEDEESEDEEDSEE